jgi:hypothetical protein
LTLAAVGLAPVNPIASSQEASQTLSISDGAIDRQKIDRPAATNNIYCQ